MVHFALISPPFYSHLRVFEALGAALQARGHRVTLVLNAGGGACAGREGAGPSIAVREVEGMRPAGGLAAIVARAARPSGVLGILRTVSDVSSLTDEFCAGGPALLKRIGADCIVGDEMEPAAGLLAEHLRLPLVSLACALPARTDPAVPLPFLSWPYDAGEAGLKRNRGGVSVARILLSAQRRTIADWAARFGLPHRERPQDCLSRTLRLAQTVEDFDFPAAPEPNLVGVGPIRARGVEAPLPFALPADRPVAFVSLGTLQGHRSALFARIARACRRLGVFSVVAHCGALSPDEAARVGADIVTDFVPQRAMLARSRLCVTHAGLNTALDALEAGVPMLAIPIAFDQPGVAARLVHHGAGLRLPRVLSSGARIESALESLLHEASFLDAARRIGRAVASGGGADVAADLIERSMVGADRRAMAFA
ncbi:glycosyltransferase [Aurantimonas sp. Leaf443]|uniref:glycosyltransferase n=1 Tax=Aurantimonas sp. Leaf443 TaxID=1736378 RepID=UPI0006F38DB0|nr:glycosyltransferase [Aurantimonas sp. Leaf443]KQT88007.1 hypothetical protein ASG48_00675 [Aurantimonas sp. Leaf443]